MEAKRMPASSGQKYDYFFPNLWRFEKYQFEEC